MLHQENWIGHARERSRYPAEATTRAQTKRGASSSRVHLGLVVGIPARGMMDSDGKQTADIMHNPVSLARSHARTLPPK